MYTEKKDKFAAVFSYLGWIFWIVAFVIRNRDDRLSHYHLNQGLILAVAGTAASILSRMHGIFGTAAGLLGVGVALLSVVGIIHALTGSEEPLPIIGGMQLI
ncbi:MAG: hypothetical protein E7317_07140 [Clostridiales bacterium]|nr:hypothetical protein [Clostridiales bacterium]